MEKYPSSWDCGVVWLCELCYGGIRFKEMNLKGQDFRLCKKLCWEYSHYHCPCCETIFKRKGMIEKHINKKNSTLQNNDPIVESKSVEKNSPSACNHDPN